MKRTLIVIAAALAAALLIVAAPALSSRPYQPAPVDFEIAPPAAPIHAAGTAVTSAPIDAPKRFNVVGLRWRGRATPHVHIRAHQAGGRWSPWRELPVGGGYTDPAWAGDADRVQYRLSRPVAGVRIHFVNTLGTATAVDRARTAIRRAAGRGVVAAAALFGSHAARAADAQPQIVPRSGWNAQDCPPRAAPQYGQVKLAFVHHTVTLNDYTPDESPSIVLGICRYHRNSNGWNDIGYNFLVDKYGTLFEGRAGGIDRPVVGAQAEGFNSQSTGIANLGDYSSTPQSEIALQSMARLIRWKLPLEGAPTSGTVQVTSAGGSTNRFPAGTSTTLNRISGHRDGNNTACPGDSLYSQLPRLRELVGSEQPPPATSAPKQSTRLDVAATPAVVKVPAYALVNGVLLTASGQPVGGATVAIEVLRKGMWGPLAQATTDAGGAFGTTVSSTVNETVRARFLGTDSLRRSTSKRAALQVRPDVTLKAVAAATRVRLRGGVNPAKPRVWVDVARRAGGRYRTIRRYLVKARSSGRFGLTIRAFKAGAYRARSRFAGDSANVGGTSPYAYFRLAKPR
jgi:hypothetical protein